MFVTQIIKYGSEIPAFAFETVNSASQISNSVLETINSAVEMIDFGFNMINCELETIISDVHTIVVNSSMTKCVFVMIFLRTGIIIDAIVAVFSKAI